MIVIKIIVRISCSTIEFRREANKCCNNFLNFFRNTFLNGKKKHKSDTSGIISEKNSTQITKGSSENKVMLEKMIKVDRER